MTHRGLIVLLIVAALCGAIGARIAGRRGLGCLASIALGLIGAAIGTWIAHRLGLPNVLPLPFAPDFSVVWAVMGSALFVAALQLLSGGKEY